MNTLVLAGMIISGAQQLLDVPNSMSRNQLARLVGCVQACPGLLLVGILVLVIAATCMAVSIGPCGLARVSMSSLQAGGQPLAQSMLWYQALLWRIARHQHTLMTDRKGSLQQVQLKSRAHREGPPGPHVCPDLPQDQLSHA